MSERQLNSLRDWPPNWVSSTIEMAVRLELCRPIANAGKPLRIDSNLHWELAARAQRLYAERA